MTVGHPDDKGPALQLTVDQVRQARRLLAWQQRELAAAAGISVTALSRFEIGLDIRPTPRAAIMRALADAGVRLDAIGLAVGQAR